MRKPGIYIHKSSGIIWLCEKLEWYEDRTTEFTIIVKGSYDGKQKINRCLITKKQYKLFQYIGEF